MNRPREKDETFEQYKENMCEENRAFRARKQGRFVHVSSGDNRAKRRG